MEYIGEHLLPGQLGHFCVVLSFVAVLLSAFAYFFATNRRETAEYEGWRNLGRYGFLLHGIAVILRIAYIIRSYTSFWFLSFHGLP